MDLEARYWAIHEVVDDLVVRGRPPRLAPEDVESIREYVDHDEIGLALEDLAHLLLQKRVPLGPEEVERVRELLRHLPSEGPYASPYAGELDAVISALDRRGGGREHRGVPPLRGGHVPGAERPGATAFPPSYDPPRIDEAASHIIATATATPLPNGRTWSQGTIDGVRIGVLADGTGSVRAVVPLDGPGVRHVPMRSPGERTPLPALLASGIEYSGRRVVTFLAPRLDPDTASCLWGLFVGGEWEELADAVAAGVDHGWGEAGATEIADLLRGFDLPVEGCAHLDARDAVLARLGQQ